MKFRAGAARSVVDGIQHARRRLDGIRRVAARDTADVAVGVDEARHDHASAELDALRVVRDDDLPLGADRDDALVLDDDTPFSMGAPETGRMVAAVKAVVAAAATAGRQASHGAQKYSIRLVIAFFSWAGSKEGKTYRIGRSRTRKCRGGCYACEAGEGCATERQLPQEMTMSVAKISEISASSTKSFEDAIAEGLKRFSRTVEGVQEAWVNEQKVKVSGGSISEYRVSMKVTFIVKD